MSTPNSERIYLNLVNIQDQLNDFKTLRKGMFFGKKINVPDVIFSKADLQTLISDSDCVGLQVHLALDPTCQVHVYLKPVHIGGGDGTHPGPGVGHGPK